MEHEAGCSFYVTPYKKWTGSLVFVFKVINRVEGIKLYFETSSLKIRSTFFNAESKPSSFKCKYSISNIITYSQTTTREELAA